MAHQVVQRIGGQLISCIGNSSERVRSSSTHSVDGAQGKLVSLMPKLPFLPDLPSQWFCQITLAALTQKLPPRSALLRPHQLYKHGPTRRSANITGAGGFTNVGCLSTDAVCQSAQL